jgi:hypothetical protein
MQLRNGQSKAETDALASNEKQNRGSNWSPDQRGRDYETEPRGGLPVSSYTGLQSAFATNRLS